MSHFSIAHPYAKAIFELAQSENAFAKWSEMLSLAGAMAQDKKMVSLIKDPKFSAEELAALFLALGKDFYTQKMQNFLVVLGKFKRFLILPDIVALFEKMRANAERIINVDLISAFPIEEAVAQRLSEALKQRTGYNIVFNPIIDKSILGGAIIRADDLDLIIDGSVRGRLANLSSAIGIS